MSHNVRRFRISVLFPAFAVAAILGVAAAAQKEPAQRVPDKYTLAADEVKQLLLLIDADKSGKISKAEFMRFMEAEFDRLDVDKSGELDIQELKQSQLRASRAAARVAAGK